MTRFAAQLGSETLVEQPIGVGAGWVTQFKRPLPERLRYRPLAYTYRAPSLFVSHMVAQKAAVRFHAFDEQLSETHLAAPDGPISRLEILYLATHGINGPNGYRVALHEADWDPLASGFGVPGPVVVILDTCNLLDLHAAAWRDQWVSAPVGRALRLVLGFCSPATVGHSPSRRGAAFAYQLGLGTPIVEAWFEAVGGTSYIGTDKPVAIAFGDTDEEAEEVLRTASLANLPGARISEVPSVARWPA